MSEKKRFIDRVLLGIALTSEIDDEVDQWHNEPSDIELHEFLGFSEDEYDLWVSSPEFLDLIVYARASRTPLVQIANDNFLENRRIAARAEDVWMVNRLKDWISRHSD